MDGLTVPNPLSFLVIVPSKSLSRLPKKAPLKPLYTYRDRRIRSQYSGVTSGSGEVQPPSVSSSRDAQISLHQTHERPEVHAAPVHAASPEQILDPGHCCLGVGALTAIADEPDERGVVRNVEPAHDSLREMTEPALTALELLLAMNQGLEPLR